MTTQELVKLDKTYQLKNKVPANAKALKKAAAAFGLTGTGKLADQVGELRFEFSRREQGGAVMETCNTCGEDQPAGIGDCPFCGAEDEPAVHQAEVVALREVWTAAQLDEATSRITTLANEGSAKWYEMGQQIADLHAAEAWKAGGHKSFKDFCQKALKMSHTFAYQIMGVAKKFTLSEFVDKGVTKLAAMLKAPEEDQPGLMEEAKKGASARQINTKAREARDAKKAANGAGKPTPPKQTAAKPAPVKEDRTITLLTKVDGGKVLKGLWRTKRTPDIGSWKDGAYCEIKLSDTVSIMIELLHDKTPEANCIGVTGLIVSAK